MGFFSKVFKSVKKFAGNVIGGISSAAPSVAGNLLGDKLASDRQKEASFENFEEQWNFKRQQGLTPWELSGASTSQAPPSPNTLGNSQAIQQASLQHKQQKFQANQMQLDRQNKLQIAETQARAPLQQAGTAQQNYQLQAGIQPHKIRQIQEQTAQLKQQRIQYWPTIFAKMGPDNVMAALAAFNSGISLERVLTAQGNVTPEERKAISQLYDKLLTARSILGKQVLTVKELATQVLNFAKKSITENPETLGKAGKFFIKSTFLGRPKKVRE